MPIKYKHNATAINGIDTMPVESALMKWINGYLLTGLDTYIWFLVTKIASQTFYSVKELVAETQ